MASANETSRSSASSKRRSRSKGARRYVLCIDNRAHRASLEKGKVYRAISDSSGERLGLIRVVDESGEDYLYPEEMFDPVELTKKAERALARA
jgi:hypothetical protein